MKMRQEAGESWNDLGPGVLHPAGIGTRRSKRPAFVPPGRERGRAQPQGMDPARVTAQFRVFAIKLGAEVTIEEIAHLVGHGSTSVTERVCRKELRPVITRGARAINELFDGDAKR